MLQNLNNLSNIVLAKDFDGNSRELDATGKGSPIIDMGAYEYSGVNDGTPTRVVLTPSAYTGTAGPLTLTATLSSALGVPTGAVTFSSDGTQIGVANAVNGIATLSNVPFTPGVHVLLATYAGQGSYPPAFSVIVIIDLSKYVGSLTMTSSPNPSFVGQAVTFNLKVSEPDGTIPSPITVTYNSAAIASLQPDATGNATFSDSALPQGFDAIVASWPGDTTHAPLSASVYQQVVTGYATTTNLSCTPNPIYIFGTALLGVGLTSSNGTPTGSIAFTDNSAALGTQSLVSGAASLSYTGEVVGTHSIVATYVPTGAFAGSSASCQLVVKPLPTNSILSVNPTTATFGSAVTLAAVVAPVTPIAGHVPSQTVTFYSGGVALGTATLNASGVGSVSVSSLPGGSDSITCVYSGDAVFATSNCNTLPINITAAASTLTLVSSANPSPALTPVTFTAHLSANGQAAPAGSVIQLTLNPSGLAPIVVQLTTDATGSASYTLSGGFIPGSYLISATFAATASLQANSASLIEVVSANPTSTTLAASPNPGQQGQTVTLTALVTALAGSAAPNGSVQFFDGTTLLGTVAVMAAGAVTSTASLPVTTLLAGAHSLSAFYIPGTTSFLPSNTIPQPFTVSDADFTLTAMQNPMSFVTSQNATNTMVVTSIGGFTGSITISCPASLPNVMTCTLASPTVQLAANSTASTAVNFTSVQTSGATFWGSVRPAVAHPFLKAGTVLSAMGLFCFTGLLRRRRRLAPLMMLLLLGVISTALTACGGTGQRVSTPPGTYALTFSATGTTQGSTKPVTHTYAMTVVVTR